MNVFAPTQPSAAHPAAIEDMSEAALDQFAASALGIAPDAGFQPRAVGVDGFARRLIAMPTQKAVGGFGFRDPGFQTPPSRSFSPSRE